MRKYLQVLIVLGAFFLIVYLKNLKIFDEDNEAHLVLPKQTVSPIEPTNTQSKGIYRDGTYAGSVEDAFYGNLQVQAEISGGRIVSVIPLQYPSDNRTSEGINSQALQILEQEAIQAQSAQVDIVSGASDSSPAFIRSLSHALSQAK